MGKLNIKVEFLSDWICGSGLSSGREVDLLPIKYDKSKLPYIPGRTFKGLIREQLQLLAELKGEFKNLSEEKREERIKELTKGIEINGNINLQEDIPTSLASFLCRNIASTRIDKKGVAEEKTLRVKQVVMPLILCGILEYNFDTEKDKLEDLKKALKLIKCLGDGRNKGFGRCRVTFTDVPENTKND